MNLANANPVANLANSADCILTGPITSHDREPFISGAKMIVITSSNIAPA